MHFFLHGSQQNINVRAALLHVISDILGSLAALISGIIIMVFHWELIDPILSILISLLILYSCLRLLNESIGILMQGVPAHLNIDKISEEFKRINGVNNIHDLHVWTMSSGKLILTAHVNIARMDDWDNILKQLSQCANSQYHIHHITLQPEIQNGSCSHLRSD